MTPRRARRSSASIGCLGCHVLDEKDRSAAGPHRTFGQPLQNIGNKTTYEWIFDWVRDPKHYNPATFMPNLRLTDAQVGDVATFLTGLKQAGGDQAKASPDQAAVDAVLLDYYKAVLPFEEAKAAVAKLDPQAKQQQLGQRVINRYGCYSCHEIKGFETTQPIGTELSEEGSKLVSRLDFAFVEGSAALVQDSPGSGPSCTTRASSTRAGSCSRSTSCACPTSTSATKRSSACSPRS